MIFLEMFDFCSLVEMILFKMFDFKFVFYDNNNHQINDC